MADMARKASSLDWYWVDWNPSPHGSKLFGWDLCWVDGKEQCVFWDPCWVSTIYDYILLYTLYTTYYYILYTTIYIYILLLVHDVSYDSQLVTSQTFTVRR